MASQWIICCTNVADEREYIEIYCSLVVKSIDRHYILTIIFIIKTIKYKSAYYYITIFYLFQSITVFQSFSSVYDLRQKGK